MAAAAVAVKVVRADVALTDHEKSLFTSEANAMATLADHPYIVDVITAGVTDAEEGGRPYLVMRYCPPPDLGARVRAQPMSVPEAISTGIKLASAIETAHRAGIIHRDIKPSNVLVTTYQEPALTDFGIAGQLSEVDQDAEVRISYPWAPPRWSTAGPTAAWPPTSTASARRSGTCSPAGRRSRSPAATTPPAASPRGCCTPRRRRSSAPTAPAALDRLLQLCLAKQPELRPQSALELARELQRIESASGYARTPIAVAGRPPGRTGPPRAPTRERRHRAQAGQHRRHRPAPGPSARRRSRDRSLAGR